MTKLKTKSVGTKIVVIAKSSIASALIVTLTIELKNVINCLRKN